MSPEMRRAWGWGLLLIVGFFLAACTRTWEGAPTYAPRTGPGAGYALAPTPTHAAWLPPTRGPGTPAVTPTPDAPHPLPTLRAQSETYIVQPGDTLGILARRYHVSVQALMAANHLSDPNLLSVGQTLIIPPPEPVGEAPAFKMLPDSELVNGPVNTLFDLPAWLPQHSAFLGTYTEEINGETWDAARIVDTVAANYSVNPRLLLALVEYIAGWISQDEPAPATLTYPLGWRDGVHQGLWGQLNWAANELNRGYYLWQVNALPVFALADGNLVRPNPTVNAGTAAVQRLLGLLLGYEAWQKAVGPEGFFATYAALFGNPFDLAVEPLVPPDLKQPPMQLPFEPGVPWYFTGGPHGAWGDGSAWAALDFAPTDIPPGCAVSPSWVTAVAAGLVVRSDAGVVVLDLDGDGYEQTGWAVLYLHIAAQDRVPQGTYLHPGERIGHPSCEGGIATGTHVHIARKYNGEWIAADGPLPFVLDGWVSQGDGTPYGGWLIQGNRRLEACECRQPENTIQR